MKDNTERSQQAQRCTWWRVWIGFLLDFLIVGVGGFFLFWVLCNFGGLDPIAGGMMFIFMILLYIPCCLLFGKTIGIKLMHAEGEISKKEKVGWYDRRTSFKFT